MYYTRRHDKFNRFIAGALILHATLFLILYFVDHLKLFKTNKFMKTQVIKSSVRVDIVGMPKFTVQELKKMKLVPLSSKKELQKKIELNKREVLKEKVAKAKKKVNLSNLLGTISKKEVIDTKKPKKNSKKVGSEKIQKNLNKLVLEGNKISSGSALTGDTNYDNAEAFVSYAQTIAPIVKPYWKLPSYLQNKDLQCRLRVYISSTGKLLKYEVFESSGVEEFDARAIKALKSVSSFPKPEKTILKKVSSGEVILGFPL